VWLNVTSTSLAEIAARMSSFWSSLADDFVQLSVERSCRFDQTVRELTRVMRVARTMRPQTSHALFLLMPPESDGRAGDVCSPRTGEARSLTRRSDGPDQYSVRRPPLP